MNIRKLRLLTTIVSFLIILVFLVTGCKGEVASEGVAKEEAAVEEKPDKELFNKYFSYVSFGGYHGLSGGVVEKTNTFLPHQEGMLDVGFKNKKNFIFRCAVLDMETNDFIERCDMTISSEGSDGLIMEVLEWTFLRPGNYEYRVYVEDKLVATLPFEVISYGDYFRGRLDEVKSYFINFFENLREKSLE